MPAVRRAVAGSMEDTRMDSPRIAQAVLDCAYSSAHGAGRARPVRRAGWLGPVLAWLRRITSARARS